MKSKGRNSMRWRFMGVAGFAVLGYVLLVLASHIPPI
jgi:hypothetical protein